MSNIEWKWYIVYLNQKLLTRFHDVLGFPEGKIVGHSMKEFCWDIHDWFYETYPLPCLLVLQPLWTPFAHLPSFCPVYLQKAILFRFQVNFHLRGSHARLCILFTHTFISTLSLWKAQYLSWTEEHIKYLKSKRYKTINLIN